MSYYLLLLLFVDVVLCRRCLPFKYFTNGEKCGDNSRVEGYYCGVGKCNIFGWCKGGCRSVEGLRELQKGDIVMCTSGNTGRWKGALALNQTHVVFPHFDRGFTRIEEDLRAAANSRLGRYCRVETGTFDHYAQLLGHVPRSDSIQPLVNIFSGSWEYQVTYWKYGVAFNPSELVSYFGYYRDDIK